jgi:excisionase family DNA binding protein
MTELNLNLKHLAYARFIIMIQSEFVTIKEAAVIFSVHAITIRRAIHKGFLVAIRVGNGPRSPYRISRKSIDKIHESIIKDLANKSGK